MDCAELIDTLWNVNTFLLKNYIDPQPELIDTLWNVNTRKCGKELTQNQELIDTLWNVNKIITRIKIIRIEN